MKVLNKISIVACLLGAFVVSCESPDMSTGRIDQVNGLLNVIIQIPGDAAEYSATKKGPYEEGEEITVKVPTTDEEPLDVTRLVCTVSLEHNCYVETKLGGEMDFTDPYKIRVVDALGNRHTNTIRVVPTPPKTKFTKLWEMTCPDLGLASRNNTGIAINEQYFALQEYWGDIFLYDKKTGNFIKSIPAANAEMLKIRTDDAGHLVTARESSGNDGFMVYYYSEAEQAHRLLLQYSAADGCPRGFGSNMSVIGDVTVGKAYIYATFANDMHVYYWQLMDGTLVTPANAPNVLRYGPAGGNWTVAPMVQRISLDDDAGHYIGYMRWVNGNTDDALRGQFNIFTPSMEVTRLNPENYRYRLLGFNVLDIENDKYLMMTSQDNGTWAEGLASLSVFDITNTAKMELGPDDDGYDKFCLFKGDMIDGWVQNYFGWGDVAVYKEETAVGYDVYIASSVVGFEPGQSRVAMYKMTYYRQ